MINGNAPGIPKPAGAVRRTVRNIVPSLPGVSHSGARQAAAPSRELREHFVSNTAHMPWNRRQLAVAHGLGTVHRQETAILRWDRGK